MAVTPAAAADPFDMFGGGMPTAAVPAGLPVLLGGEKGKGLTVHGKLARAGGQVVYQISISNATAGAVDGFMLQVGPR
jgi:hypothetical protein